MLSKNICLNCLNRDLRTIILKKNLYCERAPAHA